MTRTPRLRGREVVRALERAGFIVERTRGSDSFLKHPDCRATVVPIHSGETIGPGLMRAILRDAELTAEELEGLL